MGMTDDQILDELRRRFPGLEWSISGCVVSAPLHFERRVSCYTWRDDPVTALAFKLERYRAMCARARVDAADCGAAAGAVTL